VVVADVEVDQLLNLLDQLHQTTITNQLLNLLTITNPLLNLLDRLLDLPDQPHNLSDQLPSLITNQLPNLLDQRLHPIITDQLHNLLGVEVDRVVVDVVVEHLYNPQGLITSQDLDVEMVRVVKAVEGLCLGQYSRLEETTISLDVEMDRVEVVVGDQLDQVPTTSTINDQVVTTSTTNDQAATTTTINDQVVTTSTISDQVGNNFNNQRPSGNNFNNQPQKPYTGPLAGDTPVDQCAAALLCLPENQCDDKGIQILGPGQAYNPGSQFRVQFTICRIPNSADVGVCCRDPNYKDPWPGGMMMPGNKG